MTVLGHVQRGGTPTAYDRVLATRFGLRAIGAVHENAFGTMVALKGDVIDLVPLGEAVSEAKTVGHGLLGDAAAVLRLSGGRRQRTGALAPCGFPARRRRLRADDRAPTRS